MEQDSRRRRARAKGRSVSPQALAEIQSLLGDAPRRRDLLIEHLHTIQDRYGHLSAAHLVALAAEMRLAPVEVYEVASFYHHFDVVKEHEAPPPALTVRVCDSLSCELAGAPALLAALPDRLDGSIRVQRVPCVGRCEVSPAVIVGQNPIAQATPDKVQEAVSRRATACPAPTTVIDCPAYTKGGGYRLLRACVAGERTAESIITALDEAGLRGLGGAGFPTGRKWRIVRDSPAPRLLAVNIDEGEPGTFKDRYYMERDPHRFLEGLLIACWAVSISEVYIYIRDEYPACIQVIKDSIVELRADPPTPLPRFHVRRGAGAYICGEESAMIESVEGKRGMPRLRPPYVAEV